MRNAGYESLTAEDGAIGLRRVYSSHPNLVLLDINMPNLDGWEVCRRIRGMSDIPVIMITVNRRKADLLKGFSLGADDYVTKPFDFPELIARVDAILRRSGTAGQQEKTSTFHHRELDIDWGSRQVCIRRKPVKLSPTEFRMLSCLINNRGWLLSHEELLRKVWGPNYIGDKSFVKLYIRYLRQKIEKEPSQPEFILTERGVGYRFAAPRDEPYLVDKKREHCEASTCTT
ncbi:response regulator transcription factor [Chloroflexota bacterium]